MLSASLNKAFPFFAWSQKEIGLHQQATKTLIKMC